MTTTSPQDGATTVGGSDDEDGPEAVIIGWNLLTGGIDGADETRRLRQLERIAAWSPDLLWITEATGWHRGAGRRFTELAAATGMVHLTPVTSRVGDGYNHSVLYVRPGRVQVDDRSGLLADGAFHHGCLRTVLTIDGVPLTFFGTHLSHTGGAARLAEARHLADYGAAFGDWPENRLLVGDLNSPDGPDEEPGSWSDIPQNLLHRYCKIDEDGNILGYDRDARDLLLSAGWRDPQEEVAELREPTTGYWYANEQVPMRIDQSLVTGDRIEVVDYRTLTDDELDTLSDHRPSKLVIRFTPPRADAVALTA
ncbi:endonuclease/exonuclease/phosphatase family protein [Streptomyces sp. NPDC001889]